MNQPYEFLFRFDNSGKYRGGHTIRRDDATGVIGQPMAIGADTDFPYPDVVSEITAGIADRVKELEAECTAAMAAKDEITKVVTQAREAILNPKVSDEETVKSIKAQLETFDLPAKDKRRAEIDAQIVKLEIERAGLD